MPLIDKTYFVGELNIPDTSNAAVVERLDFFIAKYEEQLLRSLLGDALYEAYKAGIEVTPTPATKWTDLQDGKTYQNTDGKTFRWMGFKKSDTKQSMIANYVFYWWLRDKASTTTAVGEVALNTDGGVRISPAVRMSQSWNEMAGMVNSLLLFLTVNKETYTEWDPAHYWCVKEEYAPINSLNL
jgi:hypothetical protein